MIGENVVVSSSDGHLWGKWITDKDHSYGAWEGHSWITGKGEDGEFVTKTEVNEKYFTGAAKVHADEGNHFFFFEASSSPNDATDSIEKALKDPEASLIISVGCLNNWCNFEKVNPWKFENLPENLASLIMQFY